MNNILYTFLFTMAAASAVGEHSNHSHSHSSDASALLRELTFVGAKIRQPPPPTDITAGFLHIINDGDEDDVLLSASAVFAARAEIHETRNDGGVMRMRPLPQGLGIAANARVALQPGGAHLMFFGVGDINPEGEEVVLNFARHGAVTVRFSVTTPDSAHQH